MDEEQLNQVLQVLMQRVRSCMESYLDSDGEPHDALIAIEALFEREANSLCDEGYEVSADELMRLTFEKFSEAVFSSLQFLKFMSCTHKDIYPKCSECPSKKANPPIIAM